MRTPLAPAVTSPIRWLGAGALLASGGIHLDLYLTGYRAIPTIGPLFFIQTISAIAIGLIVLTHKSQVVTVSGALLALGTLTGYLFSRAFGIFGFHEVATTAGLAAGLLDCSAFTLLGYLATNTAASSSTQPRAGLVTNLRTVMATRRASYLVPALGTAALALALVSSVGATASDSRAGVSTGDGNSASIVITNFVFIPAHLTVRPGEQILIKNQDSVAHTLTATPGSSPHASFNTGDIPPGSSKYLTAPNVTGTYQYLCSIHNFMTGLITVTSR